MNSQVCIIGAGPAGLMAAIFSARSGASTVLVEGNPTIGRKLLRTGKGRCNLTHTGTIDEFVTAFGQYGRFLRHSLYEFSPEAVRNFFAENGLATKVEKNGCVFPITDRSTDVTRVLVDVVRRLGVRIIYGRKVQTVEAGHEGFVIHAGAELLHSRAVIIATGGLSWSHTGSTGDGFEFAHSLGHDIVPPRAALVPLVIKEGWPGTLQGTGVENVVIKTSFPQTGKITTSGPMMFTEDGIGGPAVLDMSSHITDYLHQTGQDLGISIDFMPATQMHELEDLIILSCAEHPKKEVAGLLVGLLPRALAITLCSFLAPGQNVLANQLTRERRKHLIELIKSLSLTVSSTRPIEEAVVTRGGVSTEQIDDKTMQSKLCRGLFFAGEVIDVDGPCGGYNLQIAFSTGALAGKVSSKI